MPDLSYVQVVEARNWSLYDITAQGQAPVTNWEALAAQGPVTETLVGGTYIFLPQPETGQTLREAQRVVRSIGACLRIEDIDSPQYAGLLLTNSLRYAFFTRLAIGMVYTRMYSYTPPQLRFTDEVVLDSEVAQAIFARDFHTMTPDEFDAERSAR